MRFSIYPTNRITDFTEISNDTLINYLFTYLHSYSMEQSPSREANRFSASQEIPHMLWNPKVHYSVYNSLPPVPILSQINPVHAPLSHFLMIHLIILPPMTGFSKYLFPSGFPTKILYTPLLSTISVTYPSPLILLTLITQIIFGKEYQAPHYVVFFTLLLPHPL